jgi:urease accessory protein
MVEDQDKMLLLLQLGDSAFPIGGFAYSSGLESALKQGFLLDIEDLRSYLVTFAEQIISFDFPYISSGHDCDVDDADVCKITELQTAYQSMLLNPPIRKASGITGSNWMKILRQLVVNDALKKLDTLLIHHKIGYEFPVIFGLSMKAAGFTLKQSLSLFFYMALRDQTSAMIRLSIAGPFMAHIELKKITDRFKMQVSSYPSASYRDAVKSGYLLELVQLTHHRVYSKLFQN